MFSEVSPRPHDTGMVTMATQVWSEFALHARAILGLPIPAIRRHAAGASVALRAEGELESPVIDGLAEAYATPDVDVRFFGKPNAGPRRRLGVVLATADTAEAALAKAKAPRACCACATRNKKMPKGESCRGLLRGHWR